MDFFGSSQQELTRSPRKAKEEEEEEEEDLGSARCQGEHHQKYHKTMVL